MTPERIAQAAREYLSDKPFTLWANYFIADDDTRAKAATWLATEIEGVLKYL